MSKRILSLVLALVMVLGTFGTVFAAEATGNEKIDWLIDQGIVKGDASGNLMLDKNIDRASVAKMVVEALGQTTAAAGMQGVKSIFPDVPAGHWSNGNINIVAGLGLMKGNAKGQFMPSAEISYAEVVTILVRMSNGFTAEEEKTAVWPASYIAKANELGILDDVTVANFSAAAVRKDILEMFYNAMVNMELGKYSIVKGIVLENNRVATLNQEEVVIEIIQEVQRAEYVKESRDKKGEQISLTIPAKVGDVENLLGKVADFTLDKNNNVVKVKVDETYKYETGSLKAIEDALKVGSTEYTVRLDERYKEDDNRIFRTYLNNKSYKYSSFAEAKKYDDKNVTEADYARVTVKNGKVLFIDAFNFDDIAPVKEVKKDGAEVYVYNDARDNAVKKFDLKSSSKVLAIKDGVISKIQMGDIAANDVIHAFSGGYIVRKDAVVTGEFSKVSENRDGEFFVHIDDEEIYIPVDANKKAVYSYDSKEFYTLEAKYADSSLKEFRKEKVTALLDLSDNLQYIGSEIEIGEFLALVARVSGNDLRVVKTDGTKVDLRANLDTKYNEKTGHRNLNNLEIGELVYLSVDGEVIEKIVNLTETAKIVSDLDTREIKFGASDKYRIISTTNVFVSPDLESRTVKAVADAYKDYPADVRAYVISGKEFSDVSSRAHVYTQRADEAHTIVFTKIKIDADLKTRIAEFDGFADRQEKEMKIIIDGVKETRKVDMAAKDMPTLKGGDIIEIKETKDDKKDIQSVKVLITANADENVFEVMDYTRSGNITLRDKVGTKSSDDKTFYITSDTVIFGNIDIANAEKVSYALEKDSKGNDTNYVKAILVRKNSAKVTGLFKAIDKTETGLVTFTAPGSFIVDGKTTYYTDNKTVLTDKDGKVLYVGNTATTSPAAAVLSVDDQVEVTATADNIATLIRRISTKDERENSAELATAKANLAKAVDKVNKLDEDDYTVATWTAFVVDRTNALKLPEGTLLEIKAKTTAINAAIDSLVFEGQAELDVAVNKAQALNENDYTAASWAKLVTALAMDETTNYEVLLKARAINNAIAELKEI